MTFRLSFDEAKLKQLKDKIKGGFDNPKRKQAELGQSCFFSGWFLAEDSDCYIKLKYTDGSVVKHELNIKRPDVIKHFDLSNDLEACGFQFSLPANKSVIIAVSLSNQDYDIWEIEQYVFPEDSKVSSLKKVWETMHVSERPSTDIQFDNYADLKECTKYLPRLFIFSEAAIVYEKFLSTLKPSFPSLESFDNFIENFKDDLWALKASKKAAENDGLSYQLDSHGAQYYCVGSYAIHDFNYILFDGLGFQFYVVQHCRNVLLVFPTFYRCIILDIEQWADFAVDKLTQLLHQRIELISKNISFHRPLLKAKFKGLNLSQARPYHYVYDYLNGLNYLEQNNLNYKTFSNEGFDFLDASRIFNCVDTFESFKQGELNEVLYSEHAFLLMPCLQYIRSTNDVALQSLSEKLKKQPKLWHSSDLGLVFWVGISTEKRSWVEQVSAIIEIINKLKEDVGRVCVVVDGRTSTLTGVEKSKDLVHKEQQIFDAIQSAVTGVNFINLIGCSMAQKIAMAHEVDVFLTSFATDSLYVSCIHGKKGVTYAAPSVYDGHKRLHIHRRAVEVPKTKVKEVGSEGKQWHERSVSMDWRDVYECIEKVLELN